MKKISFVIPCYGSEKTITSVINEITDVVSNKQEYDYEIITVNDCSPDGVLSVLKSLAVTNNKIKVLDLAHNCGKHAAVMAGYSVSDGEIIINLDDDGQCPLDRIWDLINELSDDCDIAIAKYEKKKQSALKNLGSKINAIMAAHLINKPKDLQLSNFSALKRFVLDEIIKYKNAYPYIDGLFIRTTAKIKNIEMQERERTIGQGNYTFIKSVKLWVNGFTSFSVKPLRISSFIGLICALIGFIFGIIVVINKLVSPHIAAGYSSTIALILFIGGLIMMMLGMIGEYLGRIYICINNSPQYVIRDKINVDKEKYE